MQGQSTSLEDYYFLCKENAPLNAFLKIKAEHDEGTVIEVVDFDSWTNRSAVKVVWDSGVEQIYEVGHLGKAQLQLVAGDETEWGECYTSHLPPVGKLLV